MDNNDFDGPAYFEDIEAHLTDFILSADKSITIAVAWFTNKRIKDALIERKKQKEDIVIQIVVDDNATNDRYFHDYDEHFKACGITVHSRATRHFLHYKYMVIDNQTTITGTYNYTRKANTNKEYITPIDSIIFADKFSRNFRFITEPNYLDPNVQLLFEYPAFAQQLLSTYYPFTKTLFRKYRKKIVHGACFTHPNGMYDELTYSPGFMFNRNVQLETDIEPGEFTLPVSKKTIGQWMLKRNEELIFDAYRDYEEEYHLIGDKLEQNEAIVKKVFSNQLKNTHSTASLRSLIENGVNIIIENQLWANNFALFLTPAITASILDNIPDIDDDDRLMRMYGSSGGFRVR